MAYQIPKPQDINQSVADLMAKLYGSADTMSQPGIATSDKPMQGAVRMINNATGVPGMSVAPRYNPNTVPTPMSPTGLGSASANTNLQGRAYYENLVSVGTPTEKIAGLTWLKNNPVVSSPVKTGSGMATGATFDIKTGTTKTDGTIGTDTTKTDTIVPQTYTRALSAQDIIDQGYTNPTQMAEPDPATIYADQLKQVQSEIDAANSLYNDMLVQSRNRLAPIQQARTQQGFINNVRGGTVGSGFDTGVNESITSANLDETRAEEAIINEKREQSLAGIRGQARKSAETELAYQREQKSKNADAIISEINNRPARKAAALSPVILDMLSKGVDPSKMTPDALAELAKSFGKLNISAADITSEYNKQVASQEKATTESAKDKAGLAKTEAETKKILQEMEEGKWQTVGDGSMLVNVTTGEKIVNPKTFAPSESDNKQTKEQISQTIYKQMATPEWKTKPDGMKKGEFKQKQKDYILSLGADPADYGLE